MCNNFNFIVYIKVELKLDKLLYDNQHFTQFPPYILHIWDNNNKTYNNCHYQA